MRARFVSIYRKTAMAKMIFTAFGKSNFGRTGTG
jgi:hypothetical protein